MHKNCVVLYLVLNETVVGYCVYKVKLSISTHQIDVKQKSASFKVALVRTQSKFIAFCSKSNRSIIPH
jgi:hypothetical protein